MQKILDSQTARATLLGYTDKVEVSIYKPTTTTTLELTFDIHKIQHNLH